jgi:hypothetical protein
VPECNRLLKHCIFKFGVKMVNLAKVFITRMNSQKFPYRFWGVLFGLLLSFAANAESDLGKVWINAGFYSVHFDANKGLRNANPGLGFEYALDDSWRVTAGRFINSDNAHSNYLGAYYQPWHIGDFKLGLVGGAFNGYPKAFNGGWFPAVLPVASLESRNIGLNVMLVPPLKDRLYGALSFQLKYRFEQ